MVACEACGDDVAVLWEHRSRNESMTHRRSRQLCVECHPYVSVEAAEATSDDGTDAARVHGE